MSIDGRINVDALFHDKDGTTSLKVVSLRSSDEYTTGKVAIVTGTVGTTALTLWSLANGVQFGGYRNASGNFVEFSSVDRVALRLSGQNQLGVVVFDSDVGGMELLARNAETVISSTPGGNLLSIRSNSGVDSFTAVLYGA